MARREGRLPAMSEPAAAPPARLHLSVDDVTTCLRELSEGSFSDPWQQPTLAYLHDLNRRAGLVVSLFVFERAGSWRLAHVPARHRAAFEAAAPWLRFGFHGRDAVSDYGAGGVSPAQAGAEYRRFSREVRRFAGAGSIDRLPRVHRFRGRLALIRAWRDAPDGIRGLLCADDARSEVYHLDAAARRRLALEGATFDAAERLQLVASLPRLERGGDVAAQLEQAAAKPAGRTGVPACLFTHEQNLSEARVRDRIDAAIRWARRSGAGFAFPADVLTGAQAPASRSTS